MTLLLLEEIRFQRGIDLDLLDGPCLDGLAVDRLREAMRQHDAVDLFVLTEIERDGARRRGRHGLHAPTDFFRIGALSPGWRTTTPRTIGWWRPIGTAA